MSVLVVMEPPTAGQVNVTGDPARSVDNSNVFPNHEHGCQGLSDVAATIASSASGIEESQYNVCMNDVERDGNCAPPDWVGDVDRTVIHSFKYLLRMYSMHANRGGADRQVTMGGIQQFLNKKLHKSAQNYSDAAVNCHQLRKGYGSDRATVFDLPDSVHLHIFSYLEAKELCQVSRVCRTWYDLSWDEILWKRKLAVDVHTWNVIGHNTNPDMYKECQSDLSYKHIYLQCCPEVQRILLQQNIGFHHLSGLLRSLWPVKRVPKMVMFGPGLESSTSKIARKILEDRTGLFKATGMFPGQFEGVGSGFTMKMKDTISFNLILLYTSTKQEREHFDPRHRMQHNRLLDHVRPGNAGIHDPEAGAASEHFEVQQAVRDLCRTADAYIFVVDSTTEELVESARPELMAMVQELWPCPGVPVLVLSCTPEFSTHKVSCMQVAQHLRLSEFNRPWQVHQCVVETMSGVCEGIEWAAQQAQRS